MRHYHVYLASWALSSDGPGGHVTPDLLNRVRAAPPEYRAARLAADGRPYGWRSRAAANRWAVRHSAEPRTRLVLGCDLDCPLLSERGGGGESDHLT